MSRFNSEAYDKIFPRMEKQAPTPESAVEGFSADNNPIDPVEDPLLDDPKEDVLKPVEVPDPVADPEPENGGDEVNES